MENKNDGNVPVFMESDIEPFTLVRDILKNWWVIVLGAAAGFMLMYVAVSARYVPEYTTQTTFVVASRAGSGTYSNLSSANEMAKTFKKILESSIMNKTICGVMGVDEIDAQIDAKVVEGTNLLVLSVTADTPKDSIDIIRTVMDNYSSVSLYTTGNAVMDVLEEPTIPYSPDNPLNAVDTAKKGALAGGAICLVILGMLSYFRNSVKQEKEIEKKLDARSLGAICFERKYKTARAVLFRRKSKEAILADNPVASFRFAEGYKKLAARVEYQMAKDDRQVLVVTSVSENEGKSTVASNLAITLAQQGKKVILVDGDIRRPSQFLILGVKPEEKNELGEYLKGNGQLKDTVISTGRKRLFFIGGRNCYSTSTELLAGERLEQLMAICRKVADLVIVDTPPAGLIGDAQIFAGQADAVLMVVKQNFMLAEDINEIMDSFRDNGTKILGVVLNSVQSFSSLFSSRSGGYYGYYGYYGKYGRYGRRSRSEGK